MVAKQKKYSAFGGVFTPSILTILGVIMYMRLGWVVGSSGLTMALAIILIAHLISLTTGLSISSIATDKKIKAGGIYYILSRSLGLPMGGAIGIAIFIGTALSISLYIIGFCENFLGIEEITSFTGMGNSINDYRILGTIVIVVLVILGLISTSLVIKTQFFILIAIALSLISIAIGLFTNTQYQPETSLISPSATFSAELVFAIFFPAVTGFTAGVAMSGDLKNPKRSIPQGTLAAIFTGLIVYVLLAIGLALFVDRQLLLNNNNFILLIAWSSPMVIAGIWGATLSSALGGILGAPRIMQAIAFDKLAPAAFSKTVGKNLEPRNALLLTFLIAEGGILIGELDVIARIVSMFYIAAYGFINLSFALENWASTDFRPSLKISKWVGIIGFIACFAVMFKIDTAAMVLAMLIMFILYFILAKRKTTNEYGDVWQSVWTAIMRSSLLKLNQKKLEDRNWQPNIILFSGGSEIRQKLLLFGKSITGKHGLLSNFDLIEDPESDNLFIRDDNSDKLEEKYEKGIFFRKQKCRNIYEGIETIASIYGFSGVEPNTIMFGWKKHSRNAIRFAELINKINQLNLNILIAHFSDNSSLATGKPLDVWWRGSDNNGNLALSLIKQLEYYPEWKKSRVRVLIVNPVNQQKEEIFRKTAQILDNLRIKAEITIINNEVEKKPFYDILLTESAEAALVILGIQHIEAGKEKEFVEETNLLCEQIENIILINASQRFKELQIGLDQKTVPNYHYQSNIIEPIIDAQEVKQNLIHSNIPYLQNAINNINNSIHEIISGQIKNFVAANQKDYSYMFDIMEKFMVFLRNDIKKSFRHSSSSANKIITYRKSFLSQTFRQLQQIYSRDSDLLLSQAEKFVSRHEHELTQLVHKLPDKIQLKDVPPQSITSKINSKKLFKQKKGVIYLQFHIIKTEFLHPLKEDIIRNILSNYLQQELRFIIKVQKLINLYNDELFGLGIQPETEENNQEVFSTFISKMEDALMHLKQFQQNQAAECILSGLEYETSKLNALTDAVNHGKNLIYLPMRRNRYEYQEFPNVWIEKNALLWKRASIEVMLFNYEFQAQLSINRLRKDLEDTFRETLVSPLHKMIQFLEDYQQNNKATDADALQTIKFDPSLRKLRDDFDRFNDRFNRSYQRISQQFPETIHIIPEEVLDEYNQQLFEPPEKIEISNRQLLDFIVLKEVSEPIQKIQQTYPAKLKDLQISARDLLRLVQFNLDDSNNDGIETNELKAFLNQQIHKAEQLVQQLYSYNESIQNDFSTVLNRIYDQFSLKNYAKIALNLKRYIRGHDPKYKIFKIRNHLKKLRNTIYKQIEIFWFKQSEGVLLAKRQFAKEKPQQTNILELRKEINDINLSDSLTHQIPFYYKQLFLNKQSIYHEFWVGREKEIQNAKDVFKEFEKGKPVRVLIKGEPLSGKTYFINHLLHLYNKGWKEIHIQSPLNGSVQLKDFKQAFKDAAETNSKPEVFLKNTDIPVIIILDNLELWWKRSENGLELLQEILEMMKMANNQCIFICGANVFSYDLFSKLLPINDLFTNQFIMKPLNARELKEVVLIRHQASGLKLSIGNRSQNLLFPWDYARLFNSFFNVSAGNPGYTLRRWITQITKADTQQINIEKPKQLDSEKIETIERKWHIILVQFLLHKHLDALKLAEIMKTNTNQSNTWLKILQESQLIEEVTSNVYQLNQISIIGLIKALRHKELL